MHIVDIRWRRSSPDLYELGFIAWSRKGTETEFFQLRNGEPISWEILGPRLCVGYRDSYGHRVPCPERNAIPRSGTKCGPCSVSDHYDACIRCNGEECNALPDRRDACENDEYAVYLALFGKSTVKVGVSTLRRVRTRWIEQGADYGAVVEVVKDGRAARRVESLIGRLSPVVKQVRTGRKASEIRSRLPESEAKIVLDDFIAAQTIIKTSNGIELIDLSIHYGLDAVDAEPQLWYKNSDQIIGQKMLGDIVGAKGALLVTRIAGTYRVADLKRLVGYTISTDSEVEITTQSGLDDFI